MASPSTSCSSTPLMYSPVMLYPRSRTNALHQTDSLKRKLDSFNTDHFIPEKKFKGGKHPDTWQDSASGVRSGIDFKETEKWPLADNLQTDRLVSQPPRISRKRRLFQNQSDNPDNTQCAPIIAKRHKQTPLSQSQPNMDFSADFSLNFNCTTSDNNYLTKQVSPAMQSPEFSSFAYFQPAIPDLDLEIDQFLQENSSKISPMTTVESQEPEDPNYNSFNFWRDPIPIIDLEML